MTERCDIPFICLKLCLCRQKEHKKKLLVINSPVNPLPVVALPSLNYKERFNRNTDGSAILIAGIRHFLSLLQMKALGLPTLNRKCARTNKNSRTLRSSADISQPCLCPWTECKK